MESELRCAPAAADQAMAAAARALAMDGPRRRRRGRTLLLAELQADEAEALRGAAVAAGLPASVAAAPPGAELRAAEPLLLLCLLARQLGELLAARYQRYGLAYGQQLGAAEWLLWALLGALLVLLARRWARADVVPLWRRRSAPRAPTLPPGAALVAAALVAGHALLCVAALRDAAPADLARPVDAAHALGLDALAVYTCAVLRRQVAAAGAAGAARCLTMLIAAHTVGVAATLTAIGSGLSAFPWYALPIPALVTPLVGYPTVRALALGLLYLALGYGLLRAARPLPCARLLAGAAFAAGGAFAALWSMPALAPLALFDLVVAASLLRAAGSGGRGAQGL